MGIALRCDDFLGVEPSDHLYHEAGVRRKLAMMSIGFGSSKVSLFPATSAKPVWLNIVYRTRSCLPVTLTAFLVILIAQPTLS